MDQQFGPLLYTVSIWALPAFIAITFHEADHGFVVCLRTASVPPSHLGEN
jgi:hypothetical protein